MVKNMFSGNVQKEIPKDLKSCYKTDPIVENLWVWSERLEKWGMWICIGLLIIGIVNIIYDAFEAAKLIKELDIDVHELKAAAAELGIEIKTVEEVVFESSLKWAVYCLLEFFSYHILALLVGSLASIVQHTKISANIALYHTAKAEGFTVESSSPQTSQNPYIKSSSSQTPQTSYMNSNLEKMPPLPDISEKESQEYMAETRKDKILTLIAALAILVILAIIAYFYSR